MARQQQTTDRNIPHLRDIFGFGTKWETSHKHHQEEKIIETDSAISMGSTSGEEEEKAESLKNNNKKKKSRRRENKTLTENDVKHLERHLSMKKTIRKKIMRDLQQAFVEDPNEFRVDDDIPHEQLKAEINIQSLSFGTPSQKQGRNKGGNAENTFLDMLRGNNSGFEKSGDGDSGHGGSPTRQSTNTNRESDDESNYPYDNTPPTKKTSGNFWRRFTMKNRNKR